MMFAHEPEVRLESFSTGLGQHATWSHRPGMTALTPESDMN
jgi:hypothetical protein